MHFTLKISKGAQQQYRSIKQYVDKEFGEQVREQFTERVRHLFELIAENPHLFPLYDEDENIRRVVVIKEVSMYYEIVAEEVHILLMVDNRRKSPEF